MKDIEPNNDIGTELLKMFNEDQAERVVGFANINFDQMRAHDAVRLKRAKEIYKEVKEGYTILNGKGLWHLAMLFQHGQNKEDYLIAIELANMAAERGEEQGKWLSAAAEDRYLLDDGKKQKWGTQFRKDESGQWEQFPIADDEESGVTDEMRKEKNIPARAEQLSVFLKRNDI